MSIYYLGIDIGTSSAKAVIVSGLEICHKLKIEYEKENDRDSWLKSVYYCINKSTDIMGIKPKAICLCSQVGTYILCKDDGSYKVIDWANSSSEEQLNYILNTYSSEFFINHISMMHPKLISYPIPRLTSVSDLNEYKYIFSPKDYIFYKLTGKRISDIYAWRGLANLNNCSFDSELFSAFGFDKKMFPSLKLPYDKAFFNDIPVYLGCNDFYSALLGMGILSNKDTYGFDVTGTSEHIGYISKNLSVNKNNISSLFFKDFVNYGVTASSGISIDWAIKVFKSGLDNLELVIKDVMNEIIKPPIFLPYVNGERAPIWDSKARGMFFGINNKHTENDLFYAVVESVAFSIKHIWEGLNDELDISLIKNIIVSGGAAQNNSLNLLKASLLDKNFIVSEISESGALGAVIIAMYGDGLFPTLEKASESLCSYGATIKSNSKLKYILNKRFNIYKQLYPSVKENFVLWNEYERT